MTLRQVAAKSGYSQATLSAAESGRRTPSWEVTEAFVQCCGGDAQSWRQLWELAATSATDGKQAFGQAPQAQPDRAGTDAPRYRSRAAGLIAVGALALAVIAGIAGWAVATSAQPEAATSAIAAARDGTDPYADHCKADEKQLDWQPVYFRDGRAFGTLMLMASLNCHAAWGYLDGPNRSAWTTHIIAHRIPGNATAPSWFNGDAPYGSWGNVLSTRMGCVYVEAFVVDNKGEGPHARTACIQLQAPR